MTKEHLNEIMAGLYTRLKIDKAMSQQTVDK